MVGALSLGVLPSLSYAQGGGMDLGKMISDAVVKKFQPRVQITPALTTIAITQKSATVVIANLTDDTLVVTLSVGARNRGRSSGLTMGTAATGAGSNRGGRLLAESETPAKGDSIREDSALVAWIRDFPPMLKLAPKEKKSVTVKLEIPAGMKPGVYSAWVIASTPAPSSEKSGKGDEGSMKVVINSKSETSSADGAARMMTTAAKLVYRIDASP